MQSEFADFSQQGLLSGLKLLRNITGMAAQRLGALGDEVIFPLLDLSQGERVLTSRLGRSGLALEDLDDECGLAFGSPALRTILLKVLMVVWRRR